MDQPLNSLTMITAFTRNTDLAETHAISSLGPLRREGHHIEAH